MIHFDVTTDENGDRTLKIEGTDTLVGWIEQGRTLYGQYGGKTEWRFTPADPSAPAGEVTLRGIAPAYEDARRYAATLVGA